MTILYIAKVNALPIVLDSDTIYLVRQEGNKVRIVFSDNEGFPHYIDPADFASFIASIGDQPNGIPLLDPNGNVKRIDGAYTSIQSKHDGQMVYVWEDLIQPFIVKGTSGLNNPSFNSYLGNFQGYLFNHSTMNQVWVDFHIKHDYAPGSMVYPHVHWMPYTSGATGVVRWGIEFIYAKGYGQEVFSASQTIYIEHSVASPDINRHLISEPPEGQGLLITGLETDGVIKTRYFRDAAHPNDTYPESVHAWQGDLHYQRAFLGTPRRNFDFFGGW